MDNIFYSKLVPAGSRIYYFDCRTSGNGDAYISITEVPCNGKNKKRQRVFIHREDFAKFSEALTGAIEAFDNCNK